MSLTEEHKSYKRKLRAGLHHLITAEEQRAAREYSIRDQLLSPVKYMYYSCKQRARIAKYDFALSFAEFEQLAKTYVLCPVFSVPLSYAIRTGSGAGNTDPNRASLDRVDNSKGYSFDNCWFISWRANNLKNDGTLDELKAIVKALELRQSSAALPRSSELIAENVNATSEANAQLPLIAYCPEAFFDSDYIARGLPY